MEIKISKIGDFTSPQGQILEQSFLSAMEYDTKLSEQVLNMPGMSGKKYRTLINRLIEKTSDARYLEIGSWKGSTACSAMYGNTVNLICIDNFTFTDSNGGFHIDELVDNINNVITDDIEVNIFDIDFRKVDYSAIGKFNVYFYDGPHDEKDQYDGVVLVQPALDNTFTLIVDDWNGPEVQRGTFNAIKNLNLEILCSIEIKVIDPTESNEFSDWHFGYFISVLKKG
jgi:Methyltransferase domain